MIDKIFKLKITKTSMHKNFLLIIFKYLKKKLNLKQFNQNFNIYCCKKKTAFKYNDFPKKY